MEELDSVLDKAKRVNTTRLGNLNLQYFKIRKLPIKRVPASYK
jgi:hypothetical protein